MGFLLHQNDNGAVPPWEYMEAAEDEYVPGQLLTFVSGKLAALETASTATPPYICMAKKEITSDDPILPVVRLQKNAIYETTLLAAASSAAVGGKLQVAAGGEQAATGAGTFEIVSLDGKAAGDTVRGRFV